MAQKRMFDKSIISSDNFLEMPDSSQNLYFHLSMNADDDGFVDNWKSIIRMTGHKEDDLKVLIAKSFIIPFDTGVIVIKHWRMNNYLRSDRYNETKYLKEKSQLSIQKNQEYSLENGVVYQLETNGKHSIDKNRIDKNRIDYNINNNIDNIYNYIEENFGRMLSPIEYEIVSQWEDNELTRYAIKQAVLNGAYKIKYIEAILLNYKKNNIKSVQEAQQQDEQFKTSKKSTNRKYQTTDEFNELIERVNLNNGKKGN